MRIADFAVAMMGRQTQTQAYSRQESLNAWIGDRPAPQAQAQAQAPPQSRALVGDLLVLSTEARRMLEEQATAAEVKGPDKSDPLGHVSGEDRVRIMILQAFFGISVKVVANVKGAEGATEVEPAPRSETQPAPRNGRQGWGVEYDLHESYRETETLSFSAQGVIRTADGKEIAFSVEMNMSRQFAYENHVRFRAGDAVRPVDPLVINFDGKAAELTTTKFRFDLDANGVAEYIPFLREGSGFLALDKNGDGKINDGTELFGPQTGNGFADLAAYDSDGNNWIDENDPIYDRLRIWTKNAEGKDVLFALGQKGIGAIYLGSVNAGFTMKDMQNRSLAEVQRMGLFVTEKGTAGTVQQLDIMV